MKFGNYQISNMKATRGRDGGGFTGKLWLCDDNGVQKLLLGDLADYGDGGGVSCYENKNAAVEFKAMLAFVTSQPPEEGSFGPLRVSFDLWCGALANECEVFYKAKRARKTQTFAQTSEQRKASSYEKLREPHGSAQSIAYFGPEYTIVNPDDLQGWLRRYG